MSNALVFQSDFGLSDGAVSAMYGVAHSVNSEIPIFDLTHDIPPFDIWAASYRLLQTVSYWPKYTVFVSVVDPGVGSDRKSVVVRTVTDQYIVTPDNGSLSHINHKIGLKDVRVIDENINRLPKSGASHTFHGRDIYAYTGARLAANVISFEQVGPELPLDSIESLPFMEAYYEGGIVTGMIDILDVRFGNLWTNISRQLFLKLGVDYGDKIEVMIQHDSRDVYKSMMVYGRSFADIAVSKPLVYVNSLDNIAVAINQGSFAKIHNIGTGSNWKILVRKA
ncbi:SAM hydrolase/SAM-dependent halogenase family protein [Aquibacillus albus]|uniref:S-adenosylmethionine hydrolase n=1 Tax=Aquibacillus albus TaxID=1168171 RepID=A0ABS2MX02_9BACI|nr:S-adenosyl-l-methionine hydroxide adenosyltransferase family protein [Aquibacillus albus]MBM7570427.1 S-adenosylmethionine hydrolase [Aquibacillus albus]